MLEPSKPSPSSKISGSICDIGTVKCCQVPGTSTNLKSTTLAPRSSARRNASCGVISPPSIELHDVVAGSLSCSAALGCWVARWLAGYPRNLEAQELRNLDSDCFLTRGHA